jgi:hypothetical protein
VASSPTWSFDERSSTPTLAEAVAAQLDRATGAGQEGREATGSGSSHCLSLFFFRRRSTERVSPLTSASVVLVHSVRAGATTPRRLHLGGRVV